MKIANNEEGFSLSELIAGLSVMGIILLFSTTSSDFLRGSSLTLNSNMIEQELERVQLVSMVTQSPLSVVLNQSSIEVRGAAHPLRKINLKGVKLKPSFGIFENQIKFSASGSASPGKLTLTNQNNKSCDLTVSIYGYVTNHCIPKEKS